MFKSANLIIKFFEQENKLSWFITFVIAGLIFYLSSLTFAPCPPKIFFLSCLYHLLAFFFLSTFFIFSLIKGKSQNKKLIFFAVIIAIAYGITDELHQFFVPGRTTSFLDILLNSVGIIFASVIYALLRFFRR